MIAKRQIDQFLKDLVGFEPQDLRLLYYNLISTETLILRKLNDKLQNYMVYAILTAIKSTG